MIFPMKFEKSKSKTGTGYIFNNGLVIRAAFELYST